MRISLTRSPTTSLARHRAGLLALFVTFLWVTLGAWSLLPRLAGWQSFVVPDSSMEPTLSRGDVVLGTDPVDRVLQPGAVIFLVTPHDELVIRRIVAVTPDGSYAVRSDRTERTERVAVEPTEIAAVGRVLVPYVGLPAVWFGTGNWIAAIGWALTMLVAILGVPYALRPIPEGAGWTPPWQRDSISRVELPG